MTNELTGFLGRLATLDPSLPPAVARQAYSEAKAAGDADLMVSLLSQSELPKDVLAGLGKVKTARVRAAYLSRSDLPEGELDTAVRSESRVTVLAAMAGLPEAAPKLLEVLSKVSNRNVALNVLTNEASPALAKGNAMCTLTSTSMQLSHRVRYDVEKLLTDNPDLQEPVASASTTNDFFVRSLLHSGYLSEATRTLLISRLVTEPVELFLAGAGEYPRLAVPYLVQAAQSPLYTNEQVGAAAEVLLASAIRLDSDSYNFSQLRLALVQRGIVEDTDPRVAQAASLVDPAELTLMAEDLTRFISARKTSGSGALRQAQQEAAGLLSALIRNPRTPSDVAVDLLSTSSMIRVDSMVLARPQDHVYTAAAIMANPYSLRNDSVTKHVMENKQLVLELFKVLGSPGSYRDAGLVLSTLHSLVTFDAPLLRELPWAFVVSPMGLLSHTLHYAAPKSPEALPQVARALNDLLVSELGADTGRWEILSSLGTSFSGTVADLLHVCKMA